MAKRRQLKDAAADPTVAVGQPVRQSSATAPSRSWPKIMLSVVSVLVGAVVGAFINRYLKIL
ncbi:MAG: hypothetical protein LJE63_00520 [Desulfobacteraceae bacterium]|nr:hypothetical protein [Desulfobacteraceae bacterium]